jgi:RimJ/RimL family protein N-acetyltransferase
VRLRTPRLEDAPAIVANIANPEVVRYLGTWAWNPYALEDFAGFVGGSTADEALWAIEALADGACLGMTGLDRIDRRDRHCWWGIHIGPPDRWGRGYGTEACRLATGFAFEHLDMEKVCLSVYEGNERARRVYERCGYRLEGVLRRDTMLEGRLVTRYVLSAFRDHPLYAGRTGVHGPRR